jgi:deazaflavin-dependent oxidoreductase (nitroreductase family)
VNSTDVNTSGEEPGEIMSFAEANRVQRTIRRVAASGPGSWLASRLLHHIDPPIFRLTRGKHTVSSLISGLPVVFLTTTGARSGKRRTSPVLGFPTAEGLVVIASNYGRAHHPAWYHNLRAHPEGEVSINGQTRGFRAIETHGDQRERIWHEGLTIYPGWSTYQRRATNRRIAVFVLEPTAQTSHHT